MTAPRLGRLLLVPIWLVALALLGLVAGRVLAFDRHRVLLLADAYTLWIFLPAYLILAAALCFRARALAAVAGLVVVAQLAWVLPPVLRTVAVPAAAATAPRVRIVSANVEFDNPRHARLLGEIRSYHADVIVLEEVTPGWWTSVQASGLLRSHPHVVAAPRGGAAGLAIMSRFPLRAHTVHDVGGWPIPTATLRVGGRDVHVVGVHVVAPLDTYPQNQRQQRAITAIVKRTPRPRVVAGDFNATPTNRWYGQILGLGVHEVHEALGQPFATSWPNGQHRIPPVRLDHVFVDDPPVVPLEVHQGVGPGSDHRPVILDVAVLPARRG